MLVTEEQETTNVPRGNEEVGKFSASNSHKSPSETLRSKGESPQFEPTGEDIPASAKKKADHKKKRVSFKLDKHETDTMLLKGANFANEQSKANAQRLMILDLEVAL